MNTYVNWPLSTDTKGPAVIGAGLLVFGAVFLQELVIIAIWFAIFTAVLGLGIGVLSIPIVRWTGIGYMPPGLTPALQGRRRFGNAWPLHVVSAAYYSYLTAFLAMIVEFGILQYRPLRTGPNTAGIIGGVGVGLLFVLAQIRMSRDRGHRIDRQLILLWPLYGGLLIIAGLFWDLFLP